MHPQHAPTNRLAITSFISASITAALLCVGLLPIPFTDLISYSLSGFFGIIALVTGLVGLVQIRRRKEEGAILGWIGVSVGFLTLLAALCLLSLTLAMFPLLAGWLEKFWKQVRP